MRKAKVVQLIMIVALVCSAGCASSNKGKIEGTKWVSQAATVKGTSIPAGFMRMEFRTDGSMVQQAGPLSITGRYSLGMGDNVTFTLDQEVSGRKTHVEKISISGNVLTMKDSDGTTVSFTKE
jgi:hypothetical protein